MPTAPRKHWLPIATSAAGLIVGFVVGVAFVLALLWLSNFVPDVK